MKLKKFQYVGVLSSLLLFFILGLLSCSTEEQSAGKHLEKAKAYIESEKYKEAEIELKNVIQKAPRNEKAYLQLSKVYQHLLKPDKELKNLRLANAVNPDNMETQLRLGQVYILGKQTKKARESAEIILEKEPENINAFHLLASAQVQERNINAAVNTLLKAVKIDPENPHIHLFLGFLYYYDNNDFTKAEESYLKVIAIDEKIKESYEELNTIYIKEKMFDKADALMVQMVEHQGERKNNLIQLARYFESRNQVEKAEQAYITILNEAEENDYTASYNLAVFYARTKQYDLAVKQFQKTLTINDTTRVKIDLANVYFEQENYKKVTKITEPIIETEPNNAEAKLLSSKLLIVEEKYVEAIERLNQVIAINKEKAEPYYLKAICLVEENIGKLPAQKVRMAARGSVSELLWKRGLAIESLKTAISLSPDHFPGRMMIADLYIKNKNYAQADKQIKYIIENNTDNLKAYYLYGELKIKQELWNEALGTFSKIIETNPELSFAWVKMGIIYNAINKPKEAVEKFDRALKTDPTNMNALRLIVNSYMSRNQKASALNVLETHDSHPELTPKEKAYILFLRGKIALSTGQSNLAEKFFYESIQIYPQTTPSYEALGYLAEVKNNPENGIKQYEHILSYAPRYISSYLNLSRIYQALGDMDNAKLNLQKVLEIKDNHAMAANDLAYILAEEGKQLQKALHLARIAESQDPNNPGVLDTLGWIYYKQRSYELAIHKLSQSVKISPDNPYSNYHLGWAYYDTGRYEKAREHMKIALKLDPNFKGAAKAKSVVGE